MAARSGSRCSDSSRSRRKRQGRSLEYEPAVRIRMPAMLWRFLWPVLPPILLCGLVARILYEPVVSWLKGDERFDEEAMIEWLREARPGQLKTLPEVVR